MPIKLPEYSNTDTAESLLGLFRSAKENVLGHGHRSSDRPVNRLQPARDFAAGYLEAEISAAGATIESVRAALAGCTAAIDELRQDAFTTPE
jgi:hypothetical protein